MAIKMYCTCGGTPHEVKAKRVVYVTGQGVIGVIHHKKVCKQCTECGRRYPVLRKAS